MVESLAVTLDGPQVVPDVVVGGVRYERVVATTHWIQPGEDLVPILHAHLARHVPPGGVLVVSEKAAVIATGRALPAAEVVVTPLARRLAAGVRPTEGSCGLSLPEKMQHVVDQAGRPRVVLAAAVGGVARLLGVRGAFYVVAGRVARGMDGMRPPFEHLLLPPLHPRMARSLARQMARRLGATVAIVDMNDRGGSVRAVSDRSISRWRLRRVLADNPLGQRDQRTPIGYVRAVG